MLVLARDLRVDAARIADSAVEALIDEALLTPKPGLVDRRPSPHADMGLSTMIRSAVALRGCFRDLASAGSGIGDPAVLRRELARIGREGEATMLRATGGVNTHRGAIWALGLAAGAAGMGGADARGVLARVAEIARHDDPEAPPVNHPGTRVRSRLGIGGAVAEARRGFPHAAAALDRIRAVRARGGTEDEALIEGLLVSMSTLEDTCVIARGGRSALRRLHRDASRALRRGEMRSARGRAAADALDARLRRTRISPGGSADMLALALFLDRCQER